MTPIARFKACGPRDFAVMANAAELALSDSIHRDLVSARFHFENRWMAGVAFESDPVKPMWKRGHGYAAVAAFPLETYVSVHSERSASKEDSDETECK